MDTDIIPFEYPLGARFDLPIDSSLNQLEKGNRENGNLAVTRKRITSALEALESDSRSPESMYMQIMKGRSLPESINSPLRDTTTAAVYWETKELIEALAEAKQVIKKADVTKESSKKDPKLIKNEADLLAEATLRILANKWSQKNLSGENLPDIHNSFHEQSYLQYSFVQEIMVQQHLPEVENRLKQLLDLIKNQPPIAAAKNMKAILETIDSLFLLSSDLDENLHYEQQSISVEHLKTLYLALTSERKQACRRSAESGSYDIGTFYFRLPATDDNDKIIASLKALLTSPNAKLDATSISSLERTYEEYLCKKTNIPEATLAEASAFAEAYSGLIQYLHSVASENDLSRQITEELCLFIDQVFDEILGNPFDKHTSVNFAVTSQFTATIKSSLMQAHNEFLEKIQSELNALYLSSLIVLFHKEDFKAFCKLSSSSFVHRIYRNLKEVHRNFRTAHWSVVPRFDLTDLESAKNFCASYEKLLSTLPASPWHFDNIEARIDIPERISEKLLQEHCALYFECRYYLMKEIPSTVEKILENYNKFLKIVSA